MIADFTLPGDTSQVAARLLDVAPDGQETLVSRGLWRPATGGPTKQVFQLFEDGWKFDEGHVPKLELLPKDTDHGLTGGYGRASDDQQPVTVANLELRLPVVERPGSQNGLVKQPAPRVLPDSYELAADYAGLPDLRPTLERKNLKRKGPKLFADVRCPTEWASCNNVKVKVTTKAPDAGKKPNKVASRTYKLDLGGNVRKVGMKLTKKAKRYLRHNSNLKVYVQIGSEETAAAAVKKAMAVTKPK